MSLRHIIKRRPYTSFTAAISTRSFSSLPLFHYHLQPHHHEGDRRRLETDPYSLLKEDPIQTITDLWVKTFSNKTHTFQNLTGFLSKFDIWVLTYQRSCAHYTGTFSPRNAIHFHTLQSLLSLRNTVVKGQFVWNNRSHQCIRSPNDKPFTKLISKRKLQAMFESNVPCFQDRVVQELLLLILEPVFESRFSSKSHAFRPNRNAHTVIRTIRSNFAGYLWFLKGDLSEIFSELDSNVLMGCVQKAVMDKKLLNFCENKYGFRLDNSKVEIEHISRGIQFLDHIICRRVIRPTLRYTSTGGDVVSEKGVGTLLSVTASLQQTIRQFRRLDFVKGDRDPEPLPCNPMLYSSQAHTNSQMNKFLETIADWYRYADNRKKVVGFCAYVIRSSLAKLYAARYRLKSRAKVYKIARRDLSRPLRESTNNSAPEYSDLLRMGLVDAIHGVQFSHMSLIPSCDYTPFPRNWVPDHERVIHEYIKLEDPKFFCELRRSIKQDGLNVPQDEISKILWQCKTLGVRSYQDNGKKEIQLIERQ